MAGKKISSEKRFELLLAEYKEKYNVDALDSPNDVANLHAMIRNQILIEELQFQLDLSVRSDDTIDANQIKKILDSIVALSETNMNYEKTLGIDRKSRKQQANESIEDYVTTLKQRAKEWIDHDDRLVKVYCKKCNIMVGRISGVYETTAYDAGFQCPQCKKYTTIKRVERDVFFDVKDAEWRRKYPIEIEQPKRTKAPTITNVDDDVIIGSDNGIIFGDDNDS